MIASLEGKNQTKRQMTQMSNKNETTTTKRKIDHISETEPSKLDKKISKKIAKKLEWKKRQRLQKEARLKAKKAAKKSE